MNIKGYDAWKTASPEDSEFGVRLSHEDRAQQDADILIESELADWEKAILQTLIEDVCFIEKPKTYDDASDAIETVRCFSDRLKDFTIKKN